MWCRDWGIRGSPLLAVKSTAIVQCISMLEEGVRGIATGGGGGGGGGVGGGAGCGGGGVDAGGD